MTDKIKKGSTQLIIEDLKNRKCNQIIRICRTKNFEKKVTMLVDGLLHREYKLDDIPVDDLDDVKKALRIISDEIKSLNGGYGNIIKKDGRSNDLYGCSGRSVFGGGCVVPVSRLAALGGRY